MPATTAFLSGTGTSMSSPSFWSTPEACSLALALARFFARCSSLIRGTTSTVPPVISASRLTSLSLRSWPSEMPNVVATSSNRSPCAIT